MVVPDRMMRPAQPGRHLLDRTARGAIDQDRACLVIAHQTVQLRELLLLGTAGTDGKSEVGTAKTRDQPKGITQRQPVAQICLHPRRRRGSQGEAGRTVEFLAQATDLQVDRKSTRLNS